VQLANCRSPYIIHYFGSFLSDRKLWIVTELMAAGSAFRVMKRCGPFPEASCALILHDTLEGLQYLHLQEQMHMDIKPANILFSLDGHCKLCDLGVAKGLTAAQVADPEAVDKAKSEAIVWIIFM
jgi:serine/threonine protein kinase